MLLRGTVFGLTFAVVLSCFTRKMSAMKEEATFDNSGCFRWIRLKYYHYSLWTGIYMLDSWERALFSE